MFSFLRKQTPTTAHINGVAITVQPKETLLQAALRQGLPFPHSCRVGGCAQCKCQLTSGKVKELTKTAYILSDDDLDQGYILACQSVPTSDVSVSVDLERDAARSEVKGRVIGQAKLTHDITHLRVQLDAALPFKAGQFADIRVMPWADVSRSYSFAEPVRADSQVSFFVRHVPGGRFSSWVHEEGLVGHEVVVDGPMGDFWLRPGSAPLVMVAGGSGLAPVLAMLQDAVKAQAHRPVTLLFGARQERDLYALDAIDRLAGQWQAPFRFVPVLSDEANDAPWAGARGWVADQVPTDLDLGSHAYLCGPPPMVDAVSAALQARGLQREHIHADRFTTRHDVVGAAA